jgi:ribosomal protein S18 acetylase RimI-like enzyme
LTVSCRIACKEDAGAIQTLLSDMAAEVGRSVHVTEQAIVTHGFGVTPRFRAVLATEPPGTEVLGLALFFPEYSSWRGAVGLYVQDLYVKPAGRGRGIARVLLAGAMKNAEDWAPTYLTLMVDHQNQAARAWYDGQGFRLRERGDLLVLDGPALGALNARLDV